MPSKNKQHEHEFCVSEFYTGTAYCLAVAILECECGKRIWDELTLENMD